MERPKWMRNPDGDRPKLMLPCQYKDNEVSIAPMVGAFNEHGTPIQISPQLAEKIGWIVPSLCSVTMTSGEWIENMRIREANKKKIKDTEWSTDGTGRPKFP